MEVTKSMSQYKGKTEIVEVYGEPSGIAECDKTFKELLVEGSAETD